MRWQWSPFDDLTVHGLYACLMLRQRVFVVEQDCPYQDADGLDAEAWHLLGWEGERVVACLRAMPPGQQRPEAVIGRVVTAPSHRREGRGRALMHEAHRRLAATWGPHPIHLSAQRYLERFYRSLGYEVSGPGYDEDGIPHLPMLRARPDAATG